MRNETLYHIFAMDNKYHLYDLRQYGKELYDRLELNIQDAFSNISLSKSIATFASPEQLAILREIVNITIESNIPLISLQVIFLLLLFYSFYYSFKFFKIFIFFSFSFIKFLRIKKKKVFRLKIM